MRYTEVTMKKNSFAKGDENMQTISLNLTIDTIISKNRAMNWQESHRRVH